MNKTPIITIVTVCLNNKDMLKKTVCSVKAQDYPHIDYLVIDGASTDGTRDFLSNERILRWISEPDSGIYNAMNKGIRMAKGDWVIFMNAGDTFVTSDTISKIFSQGQEADVIYGDVVKDNLIVVNRQRITRHGEGVTAAVGGEA